MLWKKETMFHNPLSWSLWRPPAADLGYLVTCQLLTRTQRSSEKSPWECQVAAKRADAGSQTALKCCLSSWETATLLRLIHFQHFTFLISGNGGLVTTSLDCCEDTIPTRWYTWCTGMQQASSRGQLRFLCLLLIMGVPLGQVHPGDMMLWFPLLRFVDPPANQDLNPAQISVYLS